MTIEGARQKCYNTTLVGVVHGAADAYGIELGAAELFGGTGHGFVANVHEELCPSGPYVWDPAPFFSLARNLGLDITDLGFFSAESAMDERARIEADLRDYLSRGVLCGVLNMEHQLIHGFDEHGFLLAEPWASMDVTPPRLTFGTWAEFGSELHITFYTIERCVPAGILETAVAALRFALELYDHPRRYAKERYGMGGDAYRNWIAAVEAGHGGTHGAWWNGMVWAECRKYASGYLELLSERFPDAGDELRQASREFSDVARRLEKAADRALEASAKIAELREARDTEADAVAGFTRLLHELDGG